MSALEELDPTVSCASDGVVQESGVRLRPMTVADVDAVMAVEVASYSHPWSRGNVTDSLSAGHWTQVLESVDGDLYAYAVAMTTVDELHLLNLTVAPAWRRRGHAQRLLEQLHAHARQQGLHSVWLEVRASNEPARALYGARGYVERGRRRHYYPTGHARREDAVLMALELAGSKEAPGAFG